MNIQIDSSKMPALFLTICKYQMPSKQQIKLFEELIKSSKTLLFEALY